MVPPTVIGDHLSQETTWKIRVRVSIFVLALFTLTVIQANRWAPYSYVGLLVNISWFVGLTIFDNQEHERMFRRQSARVMNFALNYGMSPGRLMSLSGGGGLRPDPHPSTVTSMAYSEDGHVWVVNNPEASTVETISIGGKDTQTIEKAATNLTKPLRVSRYERIADPLKWVI